MTHSDTFWNILTHPDTFLHNNEPFRQNMTYLTHIDPFWYNLTHFKRFWSDSVGFCGLEHCVWKLKGGKRFAKCAAVVVFGHLSLSFNTKHKSMRSLLLLRAVHSLMVNSAQLCYECYLTLSTNANHLTILHLCHLFKIHNRKP